MRKKLSVLVPAFNEEKTIARILLKLKDARSVYDVHKEVIVVNDASGDNTAAEVKQFMQQHPDMEIVLINHATNQGKGAALRTGIKKATGDYVIVQDADLEYDPREFDILLRLMIEDVADVVYGSRFRGGHAHRILFFWHSIGNKILTFLSNALTNLNLTDIETCYKLFKREIIQSIELKENRFGFEPEVTAKISKIKGIRIYEVAISYYGRTFAEGKKINWKDGFRAIYCIFKYNFFAKKIAHPAGNLAGKMQPAIERGIESQPL